VFGETIVTLRGAWLLEHGVVMARVRTGLRSASRLE